MGDKKGKKDKAKDHRQADAKEAKADKQKKAKLHPSGLGLADK
jgi:hypothetical protein